MKAPLKDINISGTFVFEVELNLHAKSLKAIDDFISELSEAITKAAVKEGNKPKHEVNLRAVGIQRKYGR